MPTPEELAIVLRNHQTWLESGRDRRDHQRANLCRANLQQVDLSRVNLQQADLSKANLWVALHEANLQGANLKGSHLTDANLQGDDLSGADLQGVHLHGANLQGAFLSGAKLEGANLSHANLQGAKLVGTKLQEAELFRANLAGAVFETQPASLPNIPSLARAVNLDQLTFHVSPHTLLELREAFKKAGLREQERQITYAIEHTKMLLAWDPAQHDPYSPDQRNKRPWLEKLAGKSESLFSYMLFELPCHYGMTPGRALQMLGFLIVLFSIPYMIAVMIYGDAGIWMIWLPDRVHKEKSEEVPVRVPHMFFFAPLQHRTAGCWWNGLWRGMSTALIGLYFSLLSAFSLGWRDLNVGTWIPRVQPREYTLRATGWVRTVSGIQSLLSIYLLALWVLTYFGRPFE
jgi:Pentapeptide repeats (8 copies)